MENGWTKRIEELTKSRDDWKREWRLLNAGLNMAEDKIKELTAERDADRRREYGYSQQTVDALTAERGKLEAENQRLREALEKLARLGNEPMLGNSVGNIIAQEALKEDNHEG